MLLPTELYIVGGGIVVALTFILAVILSSKSWLAQKVKIVHESKIETESHLGWSGVSLVLLSFLILSGFYGSRDPLDNPLPLVVWMAWWVGWTFLTALIGDFWKFIHPWHTLFGLLCLLPVLSKNNKCPAFDYPKWLEYWPAVGQFLIFAWIELIHPSPMDPEGLATMVLMYVIAVAAGMILFGKQAWLHHAEPFCVFFRMLGWLSPLDWGKHSFPATNRKETSFSIYIPKLRWPCTGLLDLPPLPKSGVAFVLLVLTTVSFDGLSRSFWWLALVGENPLEFPGRTELMLRNTMGMLVTYIVFLAAFELIQYLAHLTGKEGRAFRQKNFVLSMIPIAFGYHFAHYLPTFLVDIQYTAIALSDPFKLGWNLFGTREWEVSGSFLTHHQSVVFIWYFQVSGIILAHVAAVIVAHLLTQRETEKRSVIILSQIPGTLLMITYTVFGLWLLSTPVTT